MSSMSHFNRVLPYVYPDLFHTQPADSAAADRASAALAATEEDSERGQRLKRLYQRNLRNQRLNGSLTYSR